MNPFPTLLAPGYLYWLAILPLVFLLLFHHQRYQERVLPHLALLLEVLQENRLYTSVNRHSKWFQLFLFLSILICLILAASFPAGGTREWKKRYFQAIIDLSPTGIIVEKEKKSRLVLLKEKVKQLITQLKPEDHLMLLTAGARVELLTPYTTDAKKLRQALDTLNVSSEIANLPQAFQLAKELRAPGSQLFLFSDGANQRGSFCEDSDAIFLSSGQSDVNLGLQDVQFENLYYQDALLIKIFNYSTTPQIFRLQIDQNETPVHLANYAIEPQKQWIKTIPLTLEKSSPLQLRIDCPQDVFPLDNETTVFLPQKTRLLGLTSLEPFLPVLQVLQNQFRAKESLQLEAKDLPSQRQANDLVWMNGGELLSPPTEGYYVCFGTKGLGESQEERTNLEGWNWNRNHFLNRHCSYEWLYVQKAILQRFSESRVLIRARTGEALCEEVTLGNAKILYFSFVLADSNLASLATFPILMANILDWANSQPTNMPRQNFVYPETISFSYPQVARLIHSSTQMEYFLEPEIGRKALWPGKYRVEIPGISPFLMSYHPFSAEFSQIRPTVGREARFGQWLTKEAPNYREYWKPLVEIALFLFFLELIFYGVQMVLIKRNSKKDSLIKREMLV